MNFSSIEIQHLLRAWIVISVAFAILQNKGFSLSSVFFISAGISAFTVGLGFLLHEIMHKYVAQKYGCRAEFRASDPMLILALVMSFFGFLFAAPGAVFIQGGLDKARNGRISAAGPITNIALAAFFIILAFISGLFFRLPLLLQIAGYGASINAWLAVFNMLPVFGFDGHKVMQWNFRNFIILLGLSAAMMVLSVLVS
jgi:Zn-dependent protease